MTSAEFLLRLLSDKVIYHAEFDESEPKVRIYDAKGTLRYTFLVICSIEDVDFTEVSINSTDTKRTFE